MQYFFWISLAIVIYTYVGYGVVLYALVLLKRLLYKKTPTLTNQYTPTVTLIVAAYNEEAFIEAKIRNTLQLSYPKNKIKYLFVTDGCTDATPLLAAQFPEITVMHQPERSGKIVAVHRAMQTVTSEIAIFTDANTFLNQDALLKIARHYEDPSVGAVSGEKRVEIDATADATAGEGFYWKYESTLKKWDAELYSVVGAAGELFSVKTNLYQPVPNDTILDDFMISMLIAQKGYRIVYEPNAYASEQASANVTEELKRKIRIAAGGIQSIVRLPKMANPFHHFVLWFQYMSHRVLRWTVTPFFMLITLFTNAILVFQQPYSFLYTSYLVLFAAQIAFYTLATLGALAAQKEIKIKILFIPYYFCLMNYAVLAGIHRYFWGNQSVLWDKAARKQ